MRSCPSPAAPPSGWLKALFGAFKLHVTLFETQSDAAVPPPVNHASMASLRAARATPSLNRSLEDERFTSEPHEAHGESVPGQQQYQQWPSVGNCAAHAPPPLETRASSAVWAGRRGEVRRGNHALGAAGANPSPPRPSSRSRKAGAAAGTAPTLSKYLRQLLEEGFSCSFPLPWRTAGCSMQDRLVSVCRPWPGYDHGQPAAASGTDSPHSSMAQQHA